jgi:hypothetical protein
MVQRVATVAFEGIEARAVDVQVAPGLPASLAVNDKSLLLILPAMSLSTSFQSGQ